MAHMVRNASFLTDLLKAYLSVLFRNEDDLLFRGFEFDIIVIEKLRHLHGRYFSKEICLNASTFFLWDLSWFRYFELMNGTLSRVLL